MKKFKLISADELIQEDIKPIQKVYLDNFIKRWELATQEEQDILIDEYKDWGKRQDNIKV